MAAKGKFSCQLGLAGFYEYGPLHPVTTRVNVWNETRPNVLGPVAQSALAIFIYFWVAQSALGSNWR
jgi:hypothetical protein